MHHTTLVSFSWEEQRTSLIPDHLSKLYFQVCINGVLQLNIVLSFQIKMTSILELLICKLHSFSI